MQKEHRAQLQKQKANNLIDPFCHSGFGLSLVDSTARREVAYMAVTSSGVSWEMQRRKRFKRFKPNDSIDLEIAYQNFLRMIQAKGRKGGGIGWK